MADASLFGRGVRARARLERIGATGQLSGASACRRALRPRLLAGAAGKGGACCGGSGRYNDRIERSAARLASRRSPRRRKGAMLPLGRRLARARARLLPVAARAGTGASGCDATFLFGISSRRSIGASSAPLAPPSPPEVVFWCSPTACPATALDARNPFVQVACSNDPLVSRRRLRAGERYPLARRRRAKRRLARPAPRAPSCGVETCSVWCVQGVGVTWRKSNHIYTRRRGAHTAHTSVSASLVTIRSRNSILFSLSDTLRPLRPGHARRRELKRASYAVWTIK